MITEVDAPPAKAKLVVTGYISPDNDSITVRVTMSNPIYVTRPYGNEMNVNKDATVLISDGLDTLQLVYNSQKQVYQASQQLLPVIYGKTYYLKVTAPGGYEATSSCTVPEVSPPDLEIEKIDSVGNSPYTSYIVHFKFQDLPGAGDYYSLNAAEYEDHPEWGDDPYTFWNVGFDRGEQYVSDKNKDGEYFSYKTWEITFNNDSSRFYLAICLTDEHYYKYHKAIYNSDDENPFAEPYPIYSNINGGLGVFAAFTGNVIELDL